MCQEYKRGLSEAKYAHQLYWILNLIFNLCTMIAVIMIHNSFRYYNPAEGIEVELDPAVFSIISLAFYMTANLALVICLFLTQRRTRHNPRFSGNYLDEELMIGSTPTNKQMWESTNLDIKDLNGP